MSNKNLQGAHDFIFNQTINVAAGFGLAKLYKASMPEAFHDSGARDPPRCHPGTRLDYIDRITSWGSGTSEQHLERIFWMEGPAGVGKSAIAQTCAERLADRNQLGAAFFFSRPNQRDDPKRLFPSLSYQIATKFPSFRNIVDRDIHNDPGLVDKSLELQFRELLVKPLLEANGTKEYVIIVDGLDECAGINVQREIVEIIVKSVQDRTTPFRWAFFSRPESHIITSFTSDRVRPITLHLQLPVSRDIDHEILCYLTAELGKIQEEHGLPSSWPSSMDLGILVDRSAGLFIYASTVIRFVGDRNSRGPTAQLCRVISFTKQAVSNTGSKHPLTALDLFYMFILQCLPQNILRLVQKILLLNNVIPHYVRGRQIWAIANILDLSETEFRNTCAALRSVLEVDDDSWAIKFYHASFMDFLKDPHRSHEFGIFGTCLDAARQDLLERLNHIHAQSTEKLNLNHPWSIDAKYQRETIYERCVDVFFHLCSHPHPLTPSTVAALADLQFTTLLRLYRCMSYGGNGITVKAFRQNIPTELRNKAIQLGLNPVVYFYKPRDNWRERAGNHYYVLGQGRNKVICWPHFKRGLYYLRPYPLILLKF